MALSVNCIMLDLAAKVGILLRDPKSILWEDEFCDCKDNVHLRCRVTAKIPSNPSFHSSLPFKAFQGIPRLHLTGMTEDVYL